jgi:hypothetical protein
VNRHIRTGILSNSFITISVFEQAIISHRMTTINRTPWLSPWGDYPMRTFADSATGMSPCGGNFNRTGDEALALAFASG